MSQRELQFIMLIAIIFCSMALYLNVKAVLSFDGSFPSMVTCFVSAVNTLCVVVAIVLLVKMFIESLQDENYWDEEN